MNREALCPLLKAESQGEGVNFQHWPITHCYYVTANDHSALLEIAQMRSDSAISHLGVSCDCEQRIQRCSHPCISSWGCPRWHPHWSCWAAPCHPLRCVWHCGSASGTGSAPGSPATKHIQCTLVSWLIKDTMRWRRWLKSLTPSSHRGCVLH